MNMGQCDFFIPEDRKSLFLSIVNFQFCRKQSCHSVVITFSASQTDKLLWLKNPKIQYKIEIEAQFQFTVHFCISLMSFIHKLFLYDALLNAKSKVIWEKFSQVLWYYIHNVWMIRPQTSFLKSLMTMTSFVVTICCSCKRILFCKQFSIVLTSISTF